MIMGIQLAKTKFIILTLFLVYLNAKEIIATCNYVEVDDSDENENLNGLYVRTSDCRQPEGPGAPVYTKQRDSSKEDSDSDSHERDKDYIYLYYVYDHNRRGWVFGSDACEKDTKDIFAFIQSDASSPEEINGDWQVKKDNEWKHAEIEIKCEEDESSQALVLLISLLCTACILLIALFPAMWMYYTKKRDQHASRTHPRTQRTNNVTPAAIQTPPPYTEEPTVFTIQPGNNGTSASSTLPSYVHDMTYINHKRKDLILPPPPEYQPSAAAAKPPAYNENSGNESMTEDNNNNNRIEMIEMSNYTASAPPEDLPPDAELPAYTEVVTQTERNTNNTRRNSRRVEQSAPSPSCSAW